MEELILLESLELRVSGGSLFTGEVTAKNMKAHFPAKAVASDDAIS
jgi:hypothetical protein